MGIKDRDAVASQDEEAATNPEPAPVEALQQNQTVIPAGETASLRLNAQELTASAEPLALASLLLPLLVAPSADAAPEAIAEAACPVCGGVQELPLAQETAASDREIGLALSALVLGGFLSFLHQTHKRERPESEEEE